MGVHAGKAHKRLLYRYYMDNGKGQVNGQGIKSFGGTWRAVTAG